MLRSRRRRAVVALASCVLLCGCGGRPSPSTDAASTPANLSTSTPASGANEAATPSAADLDRAYSQAVRALAVDDTGTITLHLGFPGVRTSGRATYGLHPLRFSYTAQTRARDGHVGARVISVHDTLYLQDTTTGHDFGRCWARIDPNTVSPTSGSQLDAHGVPGPLAVLALGRPQSISDEHHVSVEAPVRLVVGGLPRTSFIGDLGISDTTKGEVPITVRVDGGRLTGWTARYLDLVDAADRAGTLLDARVRNLPSSYLNSYLTVRLLRTGQHIDVRAPDPSLTRDVDQAEQIPTDPACHAG